MRPFLKSWLTLCLLLPVAAHAANREQRLPVSPNTSHVKNHGSTAKAPTVVATKTTKTTVHKATVSKTTVSKTKAASPKVAQVKVTKIKTKVTTTTHTAVAFQRRSSHKDMTPSLASNKQSSKVVSRALKSLGTPYVWGGSTPKGGFDCSGLVKYAYNDVHSVKLPRTSTAMAAGKGIKVSRNDLKPGDLLFFNIESRKVDHVAIYLGNDRFIHAPRTGKNVSIDTLKKPYWERHYALAKRVLPKDQSQSKDKTLRIAQR